MKTEKWIKIKGWPYEVSERGCVRRVGRKNVLSTFTNKSGYHRVRLCLHGVEKNFSVASLVCTAFHGRRPENHTVDHIDGDLNNNSFQNLEWVTMRENVIRKCLRQTGRIIGFYYCKKKKRYSSQFTACGKKITLGWYKTEEEAVAAYYAGQRIAEKFKIEIKS